MALLHGTTDLVLKLGPVTCSRSARVLDKSQGENLLELIVAVNGIKVVLAVALVAEFLEILKLKTRDASPT